MNAKQWFFAIASGIAVVAIVALAIRSDLQRQAAKEAEDKQSEPRVWDVSNNDEEYWKAWHQRRNRIMDYGLKNGILSLGDKLPAALPTTAEDFIQEFEHPNRQRSLYIERLDIKELEKVNAHFLKEFPIVSLQDRLGYEDEKDKLASHSQRHGYDLNKVFVLLHDEWNATLYEDGGRPTSAYERPLEHEEKLSRGVRHQALEMLHRDGVRAFVNITEDFGMSRMHDMSPLDLMTYDPAPVELPEYTANQQEGWYSLNDYSKDNGPGVNFVIANLRDNYPKYMHLAFYHQFANDRWYAPQFRQAAGFESHRVSDSVNWRYDLYQPPKEPQWQVQRMELVSLLKHQEPAVYVSTTLPNMKQLVDGKTRSLDAFESDALQKLYAGEFVVSEPLDQHLRMVGAIRAGETCMECHAVQKGEMLGAFTYVLYKPEQTNISKARNLSMNGK